MIQNLLRNWCFLEKANVDYFRNNLTNKITEGQMSRKNQSIISFRHEQLTYAKLYQMNFSFLQSLSFWTFLIAQPKITQIRRFIRTHQKIDHQETQ